MGGSGNPGKSDVTFRQAKEEKPFSCVKHTEEQLLKVKMSQKRLTLIMNFIRALNDKFLCLELEPVYFLPGADPIWSEPESAPGPQTAGAAQNSVGSATLVSRYR